METQYWLFDATTRKYIETNFFEEQPENSVDFAPTITDAEKNAVLNQEGNAWIDCRTLEDINSVKVIEQRQMIYSLYDNLYTSSLARALSKSGQGLTQSQLEKLKQGYFQKMEVAAAYLNDGTIINQTLFDTISFEESVDFVATKLTDEVDYLNTNYGANIPTDNITRLQQYCYLIVVKYNLGSALWEILKAYCETFRSKLITNLDNFEFDKIEQRKALVLTISNETTLTQIQALETQFNAI